MMKKKDKKFDELYNTIIEASKKIAENTKKQNYIVCSPEATRVLDKIIEEGEAKERRRIRKAKLKKLLGDNNG